MEAFHIEYEDASETAAPITFASTKAPSTRNRSVRRRKNATIEEQLEAPPAAQRSEWLGPFWFESGRLLVVTDPETGKRKTKHKGITSLERQKLQALLDDGTITPEFLATQVVPLNDESSERARLRAHDHALTNHLKGRPLLKVVQNADGTTSIVDINVAYVAQLQRDHRLLFDPFRRGTHLFFEVGDKVHYTTVGQICYIQFGNRTDIHSYVREHEEEIRTNMRTALQTKHSAIAGTGRKRRHELTEAPFRYCRGAVVAEYDVITETRNEIDTVKRARTTATTTAAAPTAPTGAEQPPSTLDAAAVDAEFARDEGGDACIPPTPGRA